MTEKENKKKVSPDFASSFPLGGLKKLKEAKELEVPIEPELDIVPKKVENKRETIKTKGNSDNSNFFELLDFYAESKTSCLLNIDPEIRDFICRLKLNSKLRKFSYRDIASAMIRAYLKEHKEDFINIIKETYKVSILD